MERFLYEGSTYSVSSELVIEWLEKHPGAVKISAQAKPKLQRQTSWWRGEEGWLPDEFQAGVQRSNIDLDTSIKNKNYTDQTGILKQNASLFSPKEKSFVDNTLDWWRIDANETQEKNTFVEDWFGKNQLTDLLGDQGRIVENSWNGSKDIQEFLEVYGKDKASDLTEDEMAKLFLAMEEQSKTGVSDEMLEFTRKLNRDENSKTFNWIDSLTDGTLAENPTLAWEVAVSSFLGMGTALWNSEDVRAYTAKTTLGTTLAGGAIGATAGSVMPGLGTTLGGIIGLKRGFFSGIFSGVGGSIETANTFGEQLRKEVKEAGLEWNEENVMKVLKDEDTFKRIKHKAFTKGATVQGIDMIANAIAPGVGRLGGKVVKGLGKSTSYANRVAGASAAAVDMAGGAGGEYLSQRAIGEQATGKSLILEAVGEIGTSGPASIVQAIRNPKKYSLNGKDASKEDVRSFLNDKNITDEELIKADVDIQNDVDLQELLQEREQNAVIKAQIDPRVNEQADIDEIIDLQKKYNKVRGGKTESAKNQASEIKQQIKDIENQYKPEGNKFSSTSTPDALKKLESNKKIIGVYAEKVFKAKLDFAKKHSKLYNMTLDDTMSKAEIIAKYGKAVGESNGFVDPKTNTIIVNTDVAKTKGIEGGNVGNHELLHGIIKASNIEIKQETINSFLKNIGSANAAVIQKRIDENQDVYTEKYMNENRDEYFTIFSDAIENGDIKFDENVFTLVKDSIRRLFAQLGYSNVNFDNAESAYNFLKDYNRSIHKGSLSYGLKKATKGDASFSNTVSSQSKSQAAESINEIEQSLKDKLKADKQDYTKDQFLYSEEFDDIYRSIKESNGAINNYILSLGLGDKKTKKVIQYASDRLKGYNPQEKRKTGSKEAVTVGERVMSDIMYAKLDADKALAIENKKEGKTLRIDAAKRTQEGESTFDLEDTGVDARLEAFEEEDLSIRGQAKKAKADKQQYSEYRRKLGFETGSKIYNEVLDNVKKSLMMAYGTTQNITEAQLRAKAIATKLKKEYANLNSPLFKQIKNFLTYGVADVYVKRGTKDTYISNLKKFREDIVKNTSTADLVQMERNTPEADRIFTTFVKKLTSIDQVQDAVNREQLPPDALNKITKDKKTGKGAFSPSLYNKIMPTETELVSWADQPGINPVTGLRQGLKGTRKDGLSMRMVNGLVTDAIMEARQSEEVQNKISEMDIDPGSVAELGAAIGREVNVKFSKSNATGDISAAIDGAGDVNVYSQIKFSKSHREAYEKQLNKRRPDLTEDERKNAVQSVFDFVDGKEIPNHKKSKYEKMAMHYTANGFLILPEDGYKVIEAERLATQKKLDPFSFKNPNVLIETYVGEIKGTRTNPDNVKTFTNKTELTNGVTVYDVEDSKQGQLDTRKVIDTHFGKKANPWCLCARTGEYLYTRDADTNAEKDSIVKEEKAKGNLVDVYKANEGYEIIVKQQPEKVNELKGSFKLWKNYNKKGNGHQIAFQNGRLVSFRDGNEMQWWDRNDKPSNAVVVRGKKGKDGFKPVIEVGKNKETILAYEKVTGDKKNGTTIKKDLDGDVVFQETKKNGKLNGKRISFKKAGTIDAGSNDYSSMQTENYKDGSRLDFKEERTYTNKKATVKTGFGIDEITLNNITKYERSFQDSKDNIRLPDNEVTTIEGTVKQRYFKEFNDPSSITDGFVKTNLPDLTPAHERYYGIQGQKVEVVSNFEIADRKLEDVQTGKTTTVTINGVEQENRVRFSKSAENNVKFSLTTLEEKNKLDPYISKKIKEYKDGNNVIANDFYSKLQEERARGNDVITSYDAAYAQVKKQHSIDFMPLQELEDSVKTYYAKEIRSDAKKYAADYYKSLLKGLETEEQVGIVAEYLINIGRPIRSSMVDYITTNEKLLEQEVSKIFGKDYTKYFELTKARRGFKVEIRLDGKLQPLGLYQEITAIKSNPSKYAETIDKQADQAREWLYKLLDSGLDKGRIKAIISLTSYGQRSPIRKLSKLGYYVRGKAKDLVLEHEITASDILGKIMDHIDGKIRNRTELSNFLNNAYVHVLPNKINSLIKKYPGHTSNRNGKGYESMPKVLDYVKGLKLQGKTELLNPKPKDRQTFASAVKQSRSANNPTKGITVLDFDDTLATTKSLVKFTRPDGTTGTLNAEQYASTYENLLDKGYTFDFSEFNKVVKGKLAPLFQKALKLQGKFGPKNMFVLTARPPAAQKAIFDFLKANGLNIPIDNITGLGNSTAEAKALWMAEKVGEGFNDFYFADDALQNVQAVKNMLDQLDVKSKVQQARVKFSKTMNNTFNDILQEVTGIEAQKRFSAIKGRKRGESKGKFRVFIPPSHEDFVGLLYNFMGKGRRGDAHRDFLEQALVRPLNRAYRELDTAKQAIANDYKKLNEQFPDVNDKLVKNTPDGDFTFQDAIRVYLWNKHGHKIPGLTETDQAKLTKLVESDPQLQAYAETLNVISKQEDYVAPGQAWETANIRIDLVDATGRVGRAQYLSEFIENADVLFSEENLNKIEAAYGKDFREALEDMLHRIKTGVNRPKGQSGKPNKFLNWLNASVAGVMFFNTRSALLQQLSNVNYLNFADNNILAAGKAFANQKQYWKDFAFILNSDMLKQRRGGIGTDVNGAELVEAIKKARPDSMFDQVAIITGKLLRLGFLPTQMGDSIAIATGGAAFYRNRVNTYLKQGLSQKEAEAKAFTDFQDITQSTQQSARPDMTSQQQASWIGKLVLNFLNTPSQYNRIIKKAGSDLKNRRITKPNTSQTQSDMSNLSRILYYGAAQNLIFYGLQTALFAVMFGDDDDESEAFLKKKERVINGSIDTILRGSGIYGVALSTIKNMMIKFAEQREKGYNKDESAVIMEALNFSPVLGIRARKIVNAEKTLNYNTKVIDEMTTFDIDNPQWSAVTNYVEGTTTLPVNRLYQKTINVRNALDNQYTAFQRAMFFSGYTTWSLDLGDTEKMKKIKEDIKAKNKSKKKKKKLKLYEPKKYKPKRYSPR